ncbi:MAG: 4Fe-4S dicluster domain-containing protein [Proteobacteria bacterium]|nr:4Fe-4S dicluster domain-containing protein [Pseudomonadota bacterium]
MPLRRGGALLAPVQWGEGSSGEAPRALRGLARIVDGGLCHRCGSCIGICPTQVLGVDSEEYPTVLNLSACTDCDLCVKVCPGDEFNFLEEHQRLHGTSGDLTDTHGPFIDALVAHSNDETIRAHSTSGGLVTGLLCHLLETGQIDGAVVVGSQSETLWKGQAMVARSREQLLAAMKSKYAICTTNSALSEVRTHPGRYAIVGLPCQIHGYRKAAMLDPRIAERVVLAIGLFCHAAIEHEAFRVLWEGLGEKTKGATRFISRVGKHPGTPYLELADGSLYPVYFGDRRGYRPSSIEVINVLYRLYTPERCTTCFDGLADFADISVGDPWMAPPDKSVNFNEGWSFSLLRTPRGKRIFDEFIAAGKGTSVQVTAREARASNKLMAGEKRWRAFRVIETHRRQGKPIPSYGEATARFPRHNGWQFLTTEIHMLTHILCFLPAWRGRALRFFLGSGYWLFWVNHKRRALRVWIRDTIYVIRSRIFGRR